MKVDSEKYWNSFLGAFCTGGAATGWPMWLLMGRHTAGLVWAVGCSVGVLVALYRARVVVE